MTAAFCLYGTPLSNYHNKVKIALIEQGRPFTEVLERPADRWPEGSPSGKIPWLVTPNGQPVFETQAMIEYLEETRGDAPSLYPADPLSRARCRELINYLELYIEWPVRQLYDAAFWGKPLEPGLADKASAELVQGLKVLGRRAQFTPWLCGEQFTHADAAAWVHFTTLQKALHFIGADTLVHDTLPALTPYLELLAQRPSIQRIQNDLKIEFRNRFGTGNTQQR